MDRPLRVLMLPSVGAFSPQINFKRVDFPEINKRKEIHDVRVQNVKSIKIIIGVITSSVRPDQYNTGRWVNTEAHIFEEVILLLARVGKRHFGE